MSEQPSLCEDYILVLFPILLVTATPSQVVKVAFDTILKRLPDLKMTIDTPEFRPNYSLRGLVSLPVEFST